MAYLLDLQRRYRPAGRSFPQDPVGLADEARRNVFNADHISWILCGRRGPWHSVTHDYGKSWVADTTGDPASGELVFTRNQLRRMRTEVRVLASNRKREARRNRKLGQIKSLVKALREIYPAHAEAQILALLEQERAALPDLWRVRHDAQGRPRYGITVNPEKAEARQAFWTPLVVGLVTYLWRTARRQHGSPQREGLLFSMAAEILCHASEGAFPGGPQGARRAKKRFYQAL